jgi:hypothetical protein
LRVEQVDFITIPARGFFKDRDGNTVILHNRYASRVPR